MPAASLNRFNVFTQDLDKGNHQIGTHNFKFMLTNTLPVATNAVKADITEISAGNGYSAGGAATTVTRANSSGVDKVSGTAVTVTASGGSIGPFRYVVLYNDSQTSPVKPLVGWYDYGASITLNDTETLTITPDATNGLFTVG